MGLLSGNTENQKEEIIEPEVVKDEKSKRKPYTIWKVDNEEYKLKLTTQEIVSIESKIGTNLLSVISKTEDGSVPPLKIMLLITHGAMKKFHHGIKEQDVITLFDKYCEEGGSQISFMTDVFIPIYQVSGFFSQAQAETMETHLVEAKEQM
jgi:hypothetical protein